MNTSHNFIFKSTEKVILGKKMSLTEPIVGCNLELPDEHVFEGDKLCHPFSLPVAARLMFDTFADEPLPGCHEQPSVCGVGCREGRAIAERWPWITAITFFTASNKRRMCLTKEGI